MKWVPSVEEKKLRPIRSWIRFLVGGLTGFFLVYGPYLISRNSGTGIALLILGGVGLGCLALIYELYSLSRFWVALAGFVSGMMFGLAYAVSGYFSPVAVVSVGAGIWLALREGENESSTGSGGSPA